MRKSKGRSSKKIETVIIVILAIILAGMVYYRFVEMNVSKNMQKAQESIDANQIEVELATAQLAQLKQMDQKLDAAESGESGYLASYNNVKKEIQVLDTILNPTRDYSMTLSDPVQSGDLIRRSIALRFSVNDFAQTRNLIKQFAKCEYRNIIQDITYATETARNGKDIVTVNMNVTFYETIVGGKPDAGLIVEQVIAEVEEGEEGEETE